MLKQKRKRSLSSNNSKQEENNSKIPSTISVAIPSSIIDNAQSKELRSYLVGQIARALCIFKIDEIVIFHDSLNKGTPKDKLNYFITNLQYLETPQYLRKYLFPKSDDLSLCGIMNPLDSGHHLRSNEYCDYREGVVLNRPVKENKGSWVNIGLKRDCFIEHALPEKTRVTIKLDKDCRPLHSATELSIKDKKEENSTSKKYYTGKIVSSIEPKMSNIYWGYHVRLADNFESVFNESIFNHEKYDLIIGTSDKGSDYTKIELPQYRHCLIVFGGLQGLEGVVENEENSHIKTNQIRTLFDYYLNTCPNQGSRTIRTEEALLITMSVLQSMLV